ncbi:O-unit flippase [Spirochaetia bacterium]|nr:O-unit flippase [Spirochaetia bacterium]
MSVLIARHFGPGKFGQINYVAAYIAILQIFVLCGFDGNVLNDLGIGLYPESMILGTVITVRSFLAGIGFCIGLVLFYFFLDKSLITIYVIMGIQLFLYPFYIFKQWYQIKSLNKYVVIASQASLFAVSAVKISIVLLSRDVIWYAVALTGGTIIEVFILSLLKRNMDNNNILRFNKKYCKYLFHRSLPLLFSGFMGMIYLKIDQIMIGKMLSSYEVGVYSLAVTVSELIYFVPTVIINAVYPKIAEAKKNDIGYEDIIVKTASLNVIVCLLFAIIITFIAPFFVKIFYGSAYFLSVRVIQIHAWGGIFIAVGVSHACYLIFNDLQKYAMFSLGCAAVLNIIGNYILIPMHGINGAAIMSVVSYAFSSWIFFIFMPDKRTFILRTKSFLMHQLLIGKKGVD